MCFVVTVIFQTPVDSVQVRRPYFACWREIKVILAAVLHKNSAACLLIVHKQARRRIIANSGRMY